MSKDSKKLYIVVLPIGFDGRREKGEILKLTDAEAKNLDDRVAPYKEAPEESEEVTVEISEDLDAKILKAEAKKRSLPVGGTKADLVERITLFDAGTEEEDEDNNSTE